MIKPLTVKFIAINKQIIRALFENIQTEAIWKIQKRSNEFLGIQMVSVPVEFSAVFSPKTNVRRNSDFVPKLNETEYSVEL